MMMDHEYRKYPARRIADLFHVALGERQERMALHGGMHADAEPIHHGGGHVAGLDEASRAGCGQAGAAHDHGDVGKFLMGPRAALAHDAVAVLRPCPSGEPWSETRMTSVSSSMPSVRILFMRCPNHLSTIVTFSAYRARMCSSSRSGIQAVDMALNGQEHVLPS